MSASDKMPRRREPAKGEEAKRPPNTTIIIPTYNASTLLTECLRNLEATKHDLTQILVVDDASTELTAAKIHQQFPQVQIIRTPRNLGFAGACNHGFAQVTTPYVAFLNNDAFPAEGWAETLTHELEQDPELAIVCSKILRKDTRIIDSAGGIIEFPLGEAPPRGYLQPDAGQYNQPADVAYASGTAMVAKTELLRLVGGFDASYRNYFDETDLAWRLRLAGYKIRYIPNPVTQHIGSATMGSSPAAQTFWQTRNRCTTNLKNLETRNLLEWLLYEAVFAVLIPIGGLLFPPYRNHALAYLRGLASFIQSIHSTLLKRSQIQSGRRVTDSHLLKLHRRETISTLLRRYARLVQTHSQHLFAPESR